MDNIRKAQEIKHRYQSIIDNLEHNDGWLELMKLFKEDAESIDANWHYLNPYDSKDLATLMDQKTHKLALDKITNAMDLFKAQISEIDRVISDMEEE